MKIPMRMNHQFLALYPEFRTADANNFLTSYVEFIFGKLFFLNSPIVWVFELPPGTSEPSHDHAHWYDMPSSMRPRLYMPSRLLEQEETFIREAIMQEIVRGQLRGVEAHIILSDEAKTIDLWEAFVSDCGGLGRHLAKSCPLPAEYFAARNLASTTKKSE